MFNEIMLVGRLTKDPELRYTSDGVPVANVTLAVSRPFKNAKRRSRSGLCQLHSMAQNCREHSRILRKRLHHRAERKNPDPPIRQFRR